LNKKKIKIKKGDLMKRIEKHKIRKNNKYFPFILKQLEQCKKISNSAIFIIRQNFFFNKTKDNKGNEVRKYINYNDMDRIFKRDRTELYRSLIYVQSVQQILRKVHSSFDSFFKAIKDYKKNKSNYTGRPKLPRYKSSKYDELIITNQNFKQNDKVLNFKGYLKDLSFTMYNKGKANQVMFKYNGIDIDVYIIYDDCKALINKEVVDYIEDDSRIISIDLGLNNLVTITNNIGIRSIIINGKGLKSKNIYYNYQIGKYQSILATVNQKDKEKKSYKSNRLTRLRVKRNNIMNDYIHKTTRYIINYCKENNIDTIVIGNNKFQKQNKRKKQLKGLKNFVQVPIKRIIEQLKYKLEYENIRLIETEESYTSKTSFLDNEIPNKETVPRGKRIKRGIFKRPNGEYVNADVNGSLQILSKVISTRLLEKLRLVVSSNGLALNPLKIAL
jgi:putative transposase